MLALEWLRARDRGLAALRRSGRAAIVMPGLFALGDKVMGNAEIATFASFGSFAMLLLVDFTGPMRDRLQAQTALAVAGAALVTLGTLTAGTPWLAAVAMTCVAFAALFAGVVSSVLASATPALLLAFILPVSLPGPASAIPDRLAGWGLASLAALVAVAVLWPTPTQDPLRGPATAACRAAAGRLRTEVSFVLDEADRPSQAEYEQAIAASDAALLALRQAFLATPYRPTGLGTATRTVVRLVDELGWLSAVIESSPRRRRIVPNTAACAVKLAAAAVLERGAVVLAGSGASPRDLREAVARLRDAVIEMEQDGAGLSRVPPAGLGDLVSALDPTFRAQQLAFAVSQIANNIDLTAAAERRSWVDRMLGRQPEGIAGTFTAAHERAAAHIQRSSVWLHNSVRGAIGLGLAVLVANLSGAQHSFWVVLGTLSVLRSNALSTGQTAVRGLLGTAVGFIIGAALLVPIGSDSTILWFLLPLAILLAGALPAVISFAAGQAAFTVTLVILFNIIAPTGWQVGLLRVEDIALGCAVSLLVGVLFWPRGAAAALGRTLADAYRDSSGYLAEAVAFGMQRCVVDPLHAESPRPPADEAARAAAASRRLDDAFRSYLAERGAKPTSLAEMTRLVNGVVVLRLAGDAVLDLWQRDDDAVDGDRAATRAVLLASTEVIVGWYDDLAASLVDGAPPPDPLAHDEQADTRLVEALRQDLLAAECGGSATAARMIWTGDYLDAVRRLQAVVAGAQSQPAPG